MNKFKCLFFSGLMAVMPACMNGQQTGSNTLCIAPGRVITYERNYVTNDLLAKHGLDVLTVPSAALSRGRGGPRCTLRC